ncbi:MAG TPA: histone deacetylase family protein [Magnetospirillaceae bacterium]|jgi:acetoin utilization deacetylase AcuC-like enzyme
MSTLLLTHPACLDHDTGRHHPERPARLRAVMEALEAEEFMALIRVEAPLATEEQILRVHTRDLFETVKDAIPREGSIAHLDPDTAVSHGSWDAILRAAGAAVAAVDAVAKGEVRNAFCAVRPPGHHAERDGAMGFCLFNNIAIGALHARAVHGLKRIAVFDFDVHHGNGTQDIFYNDADLLYASTHQFGAYPGTGAARETGVAGNVVNVPCPPGCASGPWRDVVRETILPAIAAFQPELIMISAGFDAHAADPLANMRLVAEDFHWVTAELWSLARRVCNDRIVSTLEGGYDLDALAQSAAAHVRGLMGA